MILGLSSADGGMNVWLWKLSSLDGHWPPWYRPQISAVVTTLPDANCYRVSARSSWPSTPCIVTGWDSRADQLLLSQYCSSWEHGWNFSASWRNFVFWKWPDMEILVLKFPPPPPPPQPPVLLSTQRIVPFPIQLLSNAFLSCFFFSFFFLAHWLTLWLYITFMQAFQTTNCSLLGRFLAPLRHFLLLAFLPQGCQESLQLCCKKWKISFQLVGFSPAPHRGLVGPWTLAWISLFWAFRSFTHVKVSKQIRPWDIWDTCCCLHFCLTGARRAPKFAVKRKKSVFGQGASHLHLTGASSAPDPGLDFLILSILKFHPCKSVQADPSLRHMRHLLLLAFLPHGCEENPQICCKKEKSVFNRGRGGGGLLIWTSPGLSQLLDPSLDFLVLSFPNFHPCKSV